MRPIRLDQDVRPLSEFRAPVALFVQRVNETRRLRRRVMTKGTQQCSIVA
jgi:hypothetical protein